MNPKKPTKLRLLAGNPSNRPIQDEPEFFEADTDAPEWLHGQALKEWQILAAGMHANGMLNQANKQILATYCDLLGSYVESRLQGTPPDLKTFQQLRMMAREFGFTPSSQASVNLTKPEPKDDKAKYFT